MGLAEKIKHRREELRLSQSYVADRLGVSRQAVSKWESGQTQPSANNLAELAELFEMSLSELTQPVPEGEDKRILHANLTNLAIAMQAGMLHACVNAYLAMERSWDPLRLGINLAALFLCSVWMAFNLRYEKDPLQRKKNSRMELCYCIVQLSIAFLTLWLRIGLLGLLLHIAVVFFYLYYINPRYMNRAFTKKGLERLNGK